MVGSPRYQQHDAELRALAVEVTVAYARAARLAEELQRLNSDLARFAASVREDMPHDDADTGGQR